MLSWIKYSIFTLSFILKDGSIKRCYETDLSILDNISINNVNKDGEVVDFKVEESIINSKVSAWANNLTMPIAQIIIKNIGNRYLIIVFQTVPTFKSPFSFKIIFPFT